jgi:hypothetical protein
MRIAPIEALLKESKGTALMVAEPVGALARVAALG